MSDEMETQSKPLLKRYSSTLCEYGLLITLDPDIEGSEPLEENGTKGSTCHLTFCPDTNFNQIHPNIYGPSSLSNETKLAGGGSGVTVFSGNMKQYHRPYDDFGEGSKIVMKHGGYKDTQELWALASLSQDLQGSSSDSSPKKSSKRGRGFLKEAAREDFQKRIPQFCMIYISPCHLRRRDLWDALRKSVNKDGKSDGWKMLAHRMKTLQNKNMSMHDKNFFRKSALPKSKRAFNIYDSEEKDIKVEVNDGSLDFFLPHDHLVSLDQENEGEDGGYETDSEVTTFRFGAKGCGYEAFHSLLTDHLIPIQKKYGWKFTLGQSAIGDEGLDSPQIGSVALTEGKLHGQLLHNLIDQYVHVLQDLQELTHDEEKNIINTCQKEYEALEKDENLSFESITPEIDAFLGHSIIKNWHPKKGRFVLLYEMGKSFRLNSVAPTDNFLITPEEVVPAYYLGMLLNPDSQMREVFNVAPMSKPTGNCIFHSFYQSKAASTPSSFASDPFWKKLLHYHLYKVHSPGATQSFWNGGLSDAGLHNLFVNEEELWLFDLGESSLQCLPGFLTKFFFSFFHALGMQDDENGSWVNRFDLSSVTEFETSDIGKIQLTKDTKSLLNFACDAFEITLNEIISRIFDGEDAVRWLLHKYMTLQLLSDASFCIQKWTIKGGGRSRQDNHQKRIEKWLWRALWDLYVASFINTEDCLAKFKIE